VAAAVAGAGLGGVEGELRRLWAEAARAAQSQGEPILRAAVVNLVVVTDGRAAVPEVGATLVDIAASAPGRMIVVAPDPFAPDGLDAWPSVQCRAGGGMTLPRVEWSGPERRDPGRPPSSYCGPDRRAPAPHAAQVCCEQVTVEARGATVGELPAIVRPLLVTDLPALLWWRAPLPAESSVLDRLAREVQVVVVDTTRGAVWADGVTPGGDPLAAVSGLLARREAPDASWTMRDLAFARLTPWRELTAALFDIIACREVLGRLTAVSVAGRPGAPEVRLYLGWLASRLGWRATGPGSPVARTYERPGGGRLTVRIAPVEEGAALARVAFEGPGVRAWVQLGETTPAGDRLEAGADFGGGAPVTQVVTVDPMTEARLVAGEIGMPGDDRVYEAAVRAVIR
jgi:glucose-6-phosphate dehydrogenase assembly protein OpcA